MEFNQLPLGTQEDDIRLRERRLSSISYSTFISEPKIGKPALGDKPTSVTEGPCSHGDGQNQSYSSTCTSSLANTNEHTRPQSVHPPCGMESVSQSNSYSSMYDTPKKVVYQSLDATPVRRSFTDLQLDNGNKMKPVAVPCIAPSHQPLTPPVNTPAIPDIENWSVTSRNHAVSIQSEISYDIPRKSLQAAPLCEREKQPQIPKHDPAAFGAASNECDTSGPSFTLAPAVTRTSDERTKPLSEMIKSHPLLKHQQTDHNSLSYENTPLQCKLKCGSSSHSPSLGCKLKHVTPLKNDLIVPSHGEIQSKVLNRTTCLSTTLLESSTPTKQNDVTGSSYQRQTAEYSQVVSASMNRAQTLIARNIQELKQLDCEQVSCMHFMARMGCMYGLSINAHL